LCNGLGPALFGFIFYVFQVDLKELPTNDGATTLTNGSVQHNPNVGNAIQVIINTPVFLSWTELVFNLVEFNAALRDKCLVVLQKKPTQFHC